MHQKKKLSTTSTTNAIAGNEGTIPKKQRCGSNETDKNSSTVVQQLTVRIDLSETLTNTNSGVKTTPTGSAMDNHPYARGSFIEVLHGVKEKIIDNEGNNSDNIGGEEEGEEEEQQQHQRQQQIVIGNEEMTTTQRLYSELTISTAMMTIMKRYCLAK
mmetsp:Transcript_33692/g.37661  ORF Transcript_33692/g.37661 Transcript_33692/m.37661 type:complete len:158 (-) Transcript_33692:96-569(-)